MQNKPMRNFIMTGVESADVMRITYYIFTLDEIWDCNAFVDEGRNLRIVLQTQVVLLAKTGWFMT